VSGYTELGLGAGLWYDTSLACVAGTSNMVAGTFGELSFGSTPSVPWALMRVRRCTPV
jgi:hypothetical protein